MSEELTQLMIGQLERAITTYGGLLRERDTLRDEVQKAKRRSGLLRALLKQWPYCEMGVIETALKELAAIESELAKEPRP